MHTQFWRLYVKIGEGVYCFLKKEDNMLRK